jgi:hypothetical protein
LPFVRFSRDKRGYEYLYLVQPGSARRGRSTPRVLYWYRTPPNIRVGRRAFDEFARQTLEHQNPDVIFDWEALANTPIPPPAPDVEKWRERRRQERAARQAAREEDETEASAESTIDRAAAEGEGPEGVNAEQSEQPAVRSAAEAAIEAAQAPSSSPGTSSELEPGTSEDESSTVPSGPEPGGSPPLVPGRRRRRRRRRGGRGPQPPGPPRE